MCAKIRATLYTTGFVVNITFFFLKALFCTSQSGRNSPTERKKNWQWEQFKPCLLLSSTQMPVCVHFHLNIPMLRLSGCDGKVFQKLLDRLTSTPDKWYWQIKCSLTEPLTWLLSHVLLQLTREHWKLLSRWCQLDQNVFKHIGWLEKQLVFAMWTKSI